MQLVINVPYFIQMMKDAMGKDEHLAIGYHFRGILNFKLNRFAHARIVGQLQFQVLFLAVFTQVHCNFAFEISYKHLGGGFRLEDAVSDFATSHTKLRGKNVIDYNQLGCRYKFYAFEVSRIYICEKFVAHTN